MKFLLAVSAIIAVAVAGPTERRWVQPVAAGPAPVILPALVDFPLTELGELITAPVAVLPAPVAPVEPVSSAPLVQIILNINQASSDVSPAPIIARPEPVQIIDGNIPIIERPVPVPIFPIVPPVDVVEVAPTPVQVVETAPIAVEPVIIGTPVFPSPAIVLPEDLN